MPFKEHPMKAHNRFLWFSLLLSLQPSMLLVFKAATDGSYSAHSLLWGQVLCGKQSFSLKPVSPQPVQFRTLYQTAAVFTETHLESDLHFAYSLLWTRDSSDMQKHTPVNVQNLGILNKFLSEWRNPSSIQHLARQGKRQCNCKGHQSWEKGWWFLFNCIRRILHIPSHSFVIF